MLALSPANVRQNRLWLPDLATPTFGEVDSEAAAFKRAFAAQLLLMRAESGERSQDAVAVQVPTSVATYRRWEDERSHLLPTVWEAIRLAKILRGDVQDLFNPEQLSSREIALAKRAGRAAYRGAREVLEAEQEPGESQP